MVDGEIVTCVSHLSYVCVLHMNLSINLHVFVNKKQCILMNFHLFQYFTFLKIGHDFKKIILGPDTNKGCRKNKTNDLGYLNNYLKLIRINIDASCITKRIAAYPRRKTSTFFPPASLCRTLWAWVLILLMVNESFASNQLKWPRFLSLSRYHITPNGIAFFEFGKRKTKNRKHIHNLTTSSSSCILNSSLVIKAPIPLEWPHYE